MGKSNKDPTTTMELENQEKEKCCAVFVRPWIFRYCTYVNYGSVPKSTYIIRHTHLLGLELFCHAR